VGQDKSNLTEQQKKGTGTTTIQIRRKHNINSRTQRATLTARHHRMVLSRYPFLLPTSPPTRTQHDGTWYGIPLLSLARLGQPAQLCSLLVPGENSPCPDQTQDS